MISMNSVKPTSENLYSFCCEQFDLLLNPLGFTKVATSENTTFESDKYKFTITPTRYGEMPDLKLFEIPGLSECPSPYLGLQYFLQDYFLEWESASSKNSLSGDFSLIETEVEILRRNPWIFNQTDWLHDKSFKTAVKDSDDWNICELQKGHTPSLQEYVTRLKRPPRQTLANNDHEKSR